ncbi:MAG: efflux transporter outer membrane subunit [Gammaproteobacteria bacterium]|nr:efflux transporter outer membrane subunit [Gammaproteobacteria bacterium]
MHAVFDATHMKSSGFTRNAFGLAGYALTLVLAACTVGPAYQKPAAPAVSSYTAAPLVSTAPAAASAATVANAQSLRLGASVNPEWWKAFGSDSLDALVARALRHNPGLDAAEATLKEARYNSKAASGIFYPQVSLGLSGERLRQSGANSGGLFTPPLFNLYTGDVSVSYYPDVFGLNRLVARGAQAQVDIAADQLQAARLTLEGNVVNLVLNLAALDGEIAAEQNTIQEESELLELTRKRYELGADSQLAVLTQSTQLESNRAALPQLQQGRDQARHLLAVYLGEFPSRIHGLKTPQLVELQLPRSLPLSLPSALVLQRPDIRAAEAQLRAANAVVGEQVARMYPLLQLTATDGGQSNAWGTLFDSASRIWSLGASLVLPLFEGGTLEAQKNAAEQAYAGVFDNYRSAVLNAFSNVADVLRALQHDAETANSEKRALEDASRGFALVRSQYQSGAVDYLSLLTSEVQYDTARIAYIQAQTRQLVDTVALYVALGGGQDKPADPPAKPRRHTPQENSK